MKLKGIFLCVIGLAVLGQDAKKLSLKEALQAAVENNLDVKLEKINVDSRSISLDLTRAGYEPSVSVETSHSEFDARPSNIFEGDADKTFTNKSDDLNLTFRKSEDFGLGYSVRLTNGRDDSTSATSFGESYSSNLTLGFEQKLLKGFGFDPGVPRKDEYVAKGNLQISKLDLEVRMAQVLVDTENAYWDLVQAIDDLKVKENSLKLAQQLYDQNKVKIEVGTLAPIELVSAEATVASREADIVVAENRVKAAEDRLKKILNLPPASWSQSIQPVDEPEFELQQPGLQEALDKALRNRAEMRRSDIQNDNANLEYRYQKNNLLPELNLSGGYSWRGTSNPKFNMAGEVIEGSSLSDAYTQITDRDLPGYNVALNLVWTPFNKAAKLNLARAEVALKQREVEDAQLRLNILEEVRSALRELESGAKSIVANEKARKFREENLKAEIQKFQNGLTTNFNVSQVQDELAQARSAEIASRIAYRKALASYLKALGTLINERNIIIP
ncbi:MAG: TolC family protein [Acidobacteria bacterium]|nr:TolC family protein [Acidobacteriota bacterium]MCB9398085.1 TolC family protein [Acidobacteriota bacterium]